MDSQKKIGIIAPLFGNALEWYDFLIYASFAPIFAQIFFPSHSYFTSLIETFCLFAMGFIMRPIGGMIIGHYADHHGRKKALVISMSIMTLATLCIALIPSFDQIGFVATFLFSLLRLIQGVAIGGELPGSATYLIEQYWGKGRGFSGSLVLSSAFLGIVIGLLVTTLCSRIFTGALLMHWGWRVPYLLGGLLGLVGIFLRLKSHESVLYLNQETNAEPLKILWLNHKIELFVSIIMTSVLALGNYLLIAYTTTFLVKSEGFLLQDALTINLIALSILTVFIPIMGLLADRVHRRSMFLICLSLLSLFILPFFYYMASKNWWIVLFAEIGLALIMAPINAIVPTIIVELFPTKLRGRGVSLGYNIGQAMFGGSIPLIALGLTHYTGSSLAPGFYILFWSLLVLILTHNIRLKSFSGLPSNT